jgi:hypothetical protein
MADYETIVVLTEVDVAERARADFAADSVLVAYSQLHVGRFGRLTALIV